MIMAFTFLLMEDNVMSYMDEYKRWVENVKDEELSEALNSLTVFTRLWNSVQVDLEITWVQVLTE